MNVSPPTAVFVPDEAYTSPDANFYQILTNVENDQISYINTSNLTANNDVSGNNYSYCSSNFMNTADESITYKELIDRYGSEEDKLELAEVLVSWNMGFLYFYLANFVNFEQFKQHIVLNRNIFFSI